MTKKRQNGAAHNDKIENNETPTKAICIKGFSGKSIVLPLSNFGVGGQDSSPQSTTAHSLKRYGQCKMEWHLDKSERSNMFTFEEK